MSDKKYRPVCSIIESGGKPQGRKVPEVKDNGVTSNELASNEYRITVDAKDVREFAEAMKKRK